MRSRRSRCSRRRPRLTSVLRTALLEVGYSWEHLGKKTGKRLFFLKVMNKHGYNLGRIAGWWLRPGWATHRNNISQMGVLFPIYGKSNSCSKPPTRLNNLDICQQWIDVREHIYCHPNMRKDSSQFYWTCSIKPILAKTPKKNWLMGFRHWYFIFDHFLPDTVKLWHEHPLKYGTRCN